ncbi:MAG: TonB family protein [Myxococcota bacterium]
MNQWFRWPFSLVCGFAVAIGLFFGMSRLVALSAVRLEEDTNRRAIEFVRLKKDPREVEKKETLPERQDFQPPPTTPPVSNPDKSGAIGVALDVSMPDMNTGVQLEGRLSAGTVQDREAVPKFRARPVYPVGAAQRGIEGYVTIKFTITPRGTVDDMQVLDSQPPGQFDRAALKALSRWRYDPKLVDGTPVARPNQRVTLKFELGE